MTRTPEKLLRRYQELVWRIGELREPGYMIPMVKEALASLVSEAVAEEVEAERAECIDDARCESLCCGCSRRIVERIQARSARGA